MSRCLYVSSSRQVRGQQCLCFIVSEVCWGLRFMISVLEDCRVEDNEDRSDCYLSLSLSLAQPLTLFLPLCSFLSHYLCVFIFCPHNFTLKMLCIYTQTSLSRSLARPTAPPPLPPLMVSSSQHFHLSQFAMTS